MESPSTTTLSHTHTNDPSSHSSFGFIPFVWTKLTPISRFIYSSWVSECVLIVDVFFLFHHLLSVSRSCSLLQRNRIHTNTWTNLSSPHDSRHGTARVCVCEWKRSQILQHHCPESLCVFYYYFGSSLLLHFIEVPCSAEALVYVFWKLCVSILMASIVWTQTHISHTLRRRCV